MRETIQIALLLVILAAHIKLYIDTGYQVPAELKIYYDVMPPGHAAFYDNGKFIKYIDLR